MPNFDELQQKKNLKYFGGKLKKNKIQRKKRWTIELFEVRNTPFGLEKKDEANLKKNELNYLTLFFFSSRLRSPQFFRFGGSNFQECLHRRSSTI